MSKLPAVRKTARKRDVEALFSELIGELRSQIKGSTDPEGNLVPATASLLAVAAKVVAMTGLRPVEDGVLADDVRAMRLDLPFTRANPDEI